MFVKNEKIVQQDVKKWNWKIYFYMGHKNKYIYVYIENYMHTSHDINPCDYY